MKSHAQELIFLEMYVLRDIRKISNISASKVAKFFNMSAPNFYQCEVGEKKIDEDFVKTYAEYLQKYVNHKDLYKIIISVSEKLLNKKVTWREYKKFPIQYFYCYLKEIFKE